MNEKVTGSIKTVYTSLLDHYGQQGWWPLLDLRDNDENPTSSGRLGNYHPGDYSYPVSDKQRLEIIIGAILVQHTSWRNTEQALIALEENGCINIDKLSAIPVESLSSLITSTRYYNQKTRYLKSLVSYLVANDLKSLLNCL